MATNAQCVASRKYYHEHKEACRAYGRKYDRTHREELRKRKAVYRQRVKSEILLYYGGGKLACAKCGFDNIKALSIDHINGGGTQHRARLTQKIYPWLKSQKYPKGFQTLCMNCQFIKKADRLEAPNLQPSKINEGGK